MKVIGSILFSLIMGLTSFAQSDGWLSKLIKGADTVVLVSHKETTGIVMVDSIGKPIPLPKLIVAGRPNWSIVMEQQIISGANVDSLIEILSRPFYDRKVEIGKCFIPHHAILLIKDGRTSFIEICFGCHVFITSKDLRLLNAFDNRKWEDLLKYFLRFNFKYELSEE